MNVDRRRLTMWAILVFSVAFTGYQFVNGNMRRAAVAVAPPPAAAPAPAGQAPPPAAVVATPDAAAAPAAPVTPLPSTELAAWRVATGLEGRDPFFTVDELAAMERPPAAAPVAVAPPPDPQLYTLKLVLMEGDEGRALIDNQVVKVGDRIGDELVAEILPDAVVLERGTERRRLQVAGTRPVQITLERNR